VERALFAETIELFGAVDAVVHAVRGRIIPARLRAMIVAEFEWLAAVPSVPLSSSIERPHAGSAPEAPSSTCPDP